MTNQYRLLLSNNWLFILIFYILFIIQNCICDIHDSNIIRINKCCEKFEILLDSVCTIANDTNSDTFKPSIKDDNGNDIKFNYTFIIGTPKCGSTQIWPIYHYPGSPDELVLLPDGKLRHYARGIDKNPNDNDDENDDNEYSTKESLHYDYAQGQYCLEKAVSNISGYKESLFAKVCSPDKEIKWTDADFILRKF